MILCFCFFFVERALDIDRSSVTFSQRYNVLACHYPRPQALLTVIDTNISSPVLHMYAKLAVSASANNRYMSLWGRDYLSLP